ncbi:hypothetical protein K8R32_02900 [bacterium]|nr:hypothetical protein [bacterium]
MKRGWLIITLIISTSFIIFSFNAKADLATKLNGQILLQVEENGEAWYLYPKDQKKYYLGLPKDAFDLMRYFGVGITDLNLEKIPIGITDYSGPDSDDDGLSNRLEDALGTDKLNSDSDQDGFSDQEEISNNYDPLSTSSLPVDYDFSAANSGLIFLQTEKNGEAWYISPSDNKRYYLGRPSDAFTVMRLLSLGITNANLGTIPTGEIADPNPPVVPPVIPPSPFTPMEVKTKTANAIRINDIDKVISYVIPEMAYTVRKSLENLSDEGRLTLGNLLSAAVVTDIDGDNRIYSAEVYFDGEKRPYKFPMEKREDNWLFTKL